MNSKKIIFIFGLCACLLIAGMIYTAIAGANDGFINSGNNNSSKAEIETESKNTATRSEPLTEVQLDQIQESAEIYLTMMKATAKVEGFTEKQKIALAEVYDPVYCRMKSILKITGILDNDVPMLTFEEAKEIFSDTKLIDMREGKINANIGDIKYELLKQFNEIAGAPDLILKNQYRYFLNEDGTSYIEVDDVSIYVIKNEATGEKEKGYLFEADRILAEELAEAKAKEDALDPYEGLGIYRYYYKYATDAQKAELDKIKEVTRENEDVGTKSQYYEKKILQIVGELPENAPMLTLEQAKEICSDSELIEMRKPLKSGKWTPDDFSRFTEIVKARLDEFAGAPDVSSYSGRYVYFLNEEHTEYIMFYASDVSHVVVDENGHAFNKVELFDNSVLIKDGVYIGNSN